MARRSSRVYINRLGYVVKTKITDFGPGRTAKNNKKRHVGHLHQRLACAAKTNTNGMSVFAHSYQRSIGLRAPNTE